MNDDYTVEQIFNQAKGIMEIKNPFKRWRQIKAQERVFRGALTNANIKIKDTDFCAYMIALFQVVRKREMTALGIFGVSILVLILATISMGAFR